MAEKTSRLTKVGKEVGRTLGTVGRSIDVIGDTTCTVGRGLFSVFKDIRESIIAAGQGTSGLSFVATLIGDVLSTVGEMGNALTPEAKTEEVQKKCKVLYNIIKEKRKHVQAYRRGGEARFRSSKRT